MRLYISCPHAKSLQMICESVGNDEWMVVYPCKVTTKRDYRILFPRKILEQAVQCDVDWEVDDLEKFEQIFLSPFNRAIEIAFGRVVMNARRCQEDVSVFWNGRVVTYHKS